MMSSQEMWLATSRLPPRAGVPSTSQGDAEDGAASSRDHQRIRAMPRRRRRGAESANRTMPRPCRPCDDRVQQARDGAKATQRHRTAASGRQLGARVVRDPAGDQRAAHPPEQLVAGERRVLAAAAQRATASTLHDAAGSKTQRSATAPSTQAAGARRRASPAADGQHGARPARHGARASAPGRGRSPRPTCSARPSSSSRPVAPGSASANGRCFASSATGVWSLTSASIVPSASAGADRVAVALLAQRRHQAHRGVEVADVDVDQVQRGGC